MTGGWSTASQYAFGRFHVRDQYGLLKALPWFPVNDATAGTLTHYGLFAKSHWVVPPTVVPPFTELPDGFGHVAIRFVPPNQKDWLDHANIWRDLFIKRPALGDQYFLTIGGGPTGPPCVFSSLTAGVNRPRDVKEPAAHLQRLPVQLLSTDVAAQTLLQRTFAFQPVLDYECTPMPGTDGYNSNSFARGLLEVSSVPLPVFPLVEPLMFPGWFKPVPATFFQPQP